MILPGLLLLVSCFSLPAWAQEPEPSDYFNEPAGLPFDEEIQEQKQETGWHWQEFRFTSQVYGGAPIRFHAVYGVPDSASAQQKAPGILMTHGIFGAIRGQDTRYWAAFSENVKAGFAVLFIDWYPNFAHDFKPKTPNELKRFTTYGNIDYFTPYYCANRLTNDCRESLEFQVAIAAKRAVTWLQARPEVDGTRIGATGASYGGIFSAMFAGLDPRISAVNPCVYTGGFGPTEKGYNALGLTGKPLDVWRARFDPQVLLARRSVEILYTVGANDPTFLLTKAMDNYADMKGPKRLLIGPNAGHDYWPPEQTALFFSSVLKKQFAWPTAEGLTIKREGQELVASVKVTGDAPRKVEFFFAPIFEIDPDKQPATILSDAWKWTGVEGKAGEKGLYALRWPLPVMRPLNPRERVYSLGELEALDPKAPPAAPAIPADLRAGLVRAFVRVTDARGAMVCTPITEPIAFTDPAANASIITHVLPALDGAVRVKTAVSVNITPDVPAGQAMATLDAPLPVKAVGTLGYVVWNWRKNTYLSATLTTDGVSTPMLKVLAPFVNTFDASSFIGAFPWPNWNRGGLISFAINGKADDVDEKQRAYHGSLPLDGQEELAVDPGDAATHRLTLVMAGGGQQACNVRVTLRAADGAAETVAYRHLPASDVVLQFRFAGKVTLRVQVTAPVLENKIATQVGPTALFLD
jgi:dienelactone hydrolase